MNDELRDYRIEMEGEGSECGFYLKANNEYAAKEKARRMHPGMTITHFVEIMPEVDEDE